MGRIIVSDWITLDGFIAGPNGELDWILGDERLATWEVDLARSVEALMFGHKTYREFSGHWPNVANNPNAMDWERMQADRLNALPKYVVSSGIPETGWTPVTVVSTITPESIRSVTEASPGDILVWGSASVVGALQRQNLVDEYRLLMHPLILGGGLRLFPEGVERASLETVHADAWSSGVTELILRRKPA